MTHVLLKTQYTRPLQPNLSLAEDRPRILVVDDQPVNTKLLESILSEEGYNISTASSGAECLEKLTPPCTLPDLILLDIMMPKMDGLEVCQLLRANEATRFIPIIFITAKATKAEKLEGLNAGAVDYITKPIDIDELSARVKTHIASLKLNQLKLSLQKALQETRHTHAIQAITEGIAHNLNNILAGVSSHVDLICNHTDTPSSILHHAQVVHENLSRMGKLLSQLSLLSKPSSIALSPYPLQDALQEGINQFLELYTISPEENPIKIIYTNTSPLSVIHTHLDFFKDILIQLLKNAWESYFKQTPPLEKNITIQITLSSFENRDSFLIRISDLGCGIPESIRNICFEPFVSTHASIGRGLGLAIARQYAINLNSRITLSTPSPPKGSIILWHHPI